QRDVQGEFGKAVLRGRETITHRRSCETLVSDRRQRTLILPRLRCRVAGRALGSGVEQPARGEVAHQGPLVGVHDDAAWCQGSVIVDANERSEEHTSELQSRGHLVCRLLLEKKKIFSEKQ